MKTTTILFLLLILSSFGLTAQTLNGDWRLISFSDKIYGHQDYTPRDDPKNNKVHVKFLDIDNNGHLEGEIYPNTVLGDYSILDGNKLKVKMTFATKIIAEGWPRAFYEDMKASSSFVFSANKDTLNILCNHDSKVMKFIKN